MHGIVLYFSDKRTTFGDHKISVSITIFNRIANDLWKKYKSDWLHPAELHASLKSNLTLRKYNRKGTLPCGR